MHIYSLHECDFLTKINDSSCSLRLFISQKKNSHGRDHPFSTYAWNAYKSVRGGVTHHWEIDSGDSTLLTDHCVLSSFIINFLRVITVFSLLGSTELVSEEFIMMKTQWCSTCFLPAIVLSLEARLHTLVWPPASFVAHIFGSIIREITMEIPISFFIHSRIFTIIALLIMEKALLMNIENNMAIIRTIKWMVPHVSRIGEW